MKGHAGQVRFGSTHPQSWWPVVAASLLVSAASLALAAHVFWRGAEERAALERAEASLKLTNAQRLDALGRIRQLQAALSAQLDLIREQERLLQEKGSRASSSEKADQEKLREGMKLQQIEAFWRESETAFREKLGEKSVSLERQGRILRLSLPTDELFDQKTFELNRAGRETLRQIATAHQQAIPSALLVIEGHTDRVPVGPFQRERFPSNWELSAWRAVQALRFLLAQGIPVTMLQAEAYGPSRPVVEPEPPEGSAENRRLVLRIELNEPPEIDDLLEAQTPSSQPTL